MISWAGVDRSWSFLEDLAGAEGRWAAWSSWLKLKGAGRLSAPVSFSQDLHRRPPSTGDLLLSTPAKISTDDHFLSTTAKTSKWDHLPATQARTSTTDHLPLTSAKSSTGDHLISTTAQILAGVDGRWSSVEVFVGLGWS